MREVRDPTFAAFRRFSAGFDADVVWLSRVYEELPLSRWDGEGELSLGVGDGVAVPQFDVLALVSRSTVGVVLVPPLVGDRGSRHGAIRTLFDDFAPDLDPPRDRHFELVFAGARRPLEVVPHRQIRFPLGRVDECFEPIPQERPDAEFSLSSVRAVT